MLIAFSTSYPYTDVIKLESLFECFLINSCPASIYVIVNQLRED